jgi:hypothetical protein
MIDTGMIVLFFSGIGLALVMAYAFWVEFRVLRLKLDLMTIILDFAQEAKRLGIKDHPEFLKIQLATLRTVKHADRWSYPSFLYFLLKSEANGLRIGPPPVKTNDPQVINLIGRYNIQFGMRLADYLICETLCGWILFFVLRVIPKFTKSENERLVSHWFVPQDELQTV